MLFGLCSFASHAGLSRGQGPQAAREPREGKENSGVFQAAFARAGNPSLVPPRWARAERGDAVGHHAGQAHGRLPFSHSGQLSGTEGPDPHRPAVPRLRIPLGTPTPLKQPPLPPERSPAGLRARRGAAIPRTLPTSSLPRALTRVPSRRSLEMPWVSLEMPGCSQRRDPHP